ncbi:MAG: putative UspA domain protein [Dehalococcoidia bacterium]|nr:putative UspA domain protein [Dehalococcoidia bacterium]
MEARDLMSTPVIVIKADAKVEEAAELMLAHHISCLPVLDDEGHLVGILTQTDFGLHQRFVPLAGDLYTVLGSWATPKTLEEIVHVARDRPVKDVMTHPVITVQEDTPISEVVRLMLSKDVYHLPVVRGKQVVGLVTRHDLLKLLS